MNEYTRCVRSWWIGRHGKLLDVKKLFNVGAVTVVRVITAGDPFRNYTAESVECSLTRKTYGLFVGVRRAGEHKQNVGQHVLHGGQYFKINRKS